jgi:hypothetical protein
VNKPREDGELSTPSESETPLSHLEETESVPSKADSSSDADSTERKRGHDEDLLIFQPHASANVKISEEYQETFKSHCAIL